MDTVCHALTVIVYKNGGYRCYKVNKTLIAVCDHLIRMRCCIFI